VALQTQLRGYLFVFRWRIRKKYLVDDKPIQRCIPGWVVDILDNSVQGITDGTAQLGFF
jgi:hypothetical protein